MEIWTVSRTPRKRFRPCAASFASVSTVCVSCLVFASCRIRARRRCRPSLSLLSPCQLPWWWKWEEWKIWKKWDIMKLWNLLKTTGNPTFLDYHEISKVTKEIHSAHVMVKTRMTKNQRCHVRLSAANTVAKCCKYIILYILLWSARDTNQGNYKRKKKCPAYINTMKQLLLFPSHVFTPCMRLLYSFMTEFEVASMWLSTKKWFNKKINIRDLISKTLITTKTSDTQN